MRRAITKGLVAACLMTFGLLFLPASASALSSEFVDSSNSPGDWWNTYNSVNIRGVDPVTGESDFLQAPTAEFKLFYKTSGAGATGLAQFQVRVHEGCSTRGTINRGAQFEMLRYSGGRWNVFATKRNTVPADCSGQDILFTVNRSDLASFPSLYSSEYGLVMLRATKINGMGSKAFRVIAENGNGLVTFNELSESAAAAAGRPSFNAFSVKDGNNPFQSERQYTFRFSPSCTYRTTYGSTAWLKWYDADWDAINENNSFNIEFTITRRSRASGATTWSRTINGTSAPVNIGGDDSYRELALPITGPDDEFIWSWSNVNSFNGIQVWMPFSEMQNHLNATVGCGSTPNPSNVSCSVVVAPAVVSPGQQFNATFSITNNTGAAIRRSAGYKLAAVGALSGSTTDNYLAPNLTSYVRQDWTGSDQINNGETRVFTVQYTASGPNSANMTSTGPYGAPMPNGIHPFEWRVYHEGGAGWLGAKCGGSTRVTVNTGPVVTCSVRINPISPAVGQAIQVTFTVANSPTAGGDINAGNSSPIRYSVVDSGGGVIVPVTNAAYPLPVAIGSSSDAVVNNVPTGSGSSFSIIASTVVNGSSIDCNTGAITPGNKPYMKFYGADVSAGGSFNEGSNPCQIAPGAGAIQAYALNDNPAYPNAYAGSSVEFGAFATGDVRGSSASNPNDEGYGFYSASQRSDGAQGLYLTFSNIVYGSASPYQALFPHWNTDFWGGQFSNTAHCIDDYYTATRIGTPTTIPSGGGGTIVTTHGNLNTDGQYSATGPVRLQSNGSLYDKRATLYVDGDVFIENNITYNTNFGAGTFPYLTIIAKGSIFISQSVTNVDGLLIAQPQLDGSEGEIITCASSAGFVFRAVGMANVFGQCGSKLTVHGALIAQRVHFLRSNGTVGAATNTGASTDASIAEVIELTPEFYLGEPMFKLKSGASDARGYQSIQALPPIF